MADKNIFMHRVRAFFVRTASISNVVGASVLFALVAIMNSDVVARGIFHAPIRGVVELVIFALVLIVFLQLPDVVQGNRLTRSDGFLLLLDNSKPKLASLIRRLIDLVAAVFFFMVAWTVWPEFVESIESCHFVTPPEFGPPPSGDFFKDFSDAFARCDYFGTPGIFTAPWWPAKLAIFFGILMSAILLSFKAVFGSKPDNPSVTELAAK